MSAAANGESAERCAPAQIAVFDLDHTLTYWDTAARFFLWLLGRDPWKWALGAPVLLLLSPLALVSETRGIPVRLAVWLATFGRGEETLAVLARAHITQVSMRHGSFLRPEGRVRIEAHLSKGHTVVVATGALEILAREILDAERLTEVAVVGSSLRSRLGGLVVRRHCHGLHKIAMLQERGFAPPWAVVYSDHESDLPLLQAGTRQFIVNAKPQTVIRLLALLGPSATAVTWR